MFLTVAAVRPITNALRTSLNQGAGTPASH